jgi:hypothetical protein
MMPIDQPAKPFPIRTWPCRVEEDADVEGLSARVERLRDLLKEAKATTSWMPEDWKRREREALANNV